MVLSLPFWKTGFEMTGGNCRKEHTARENKRSMSPGYAPRVRLWLVRNGNLSGLAFRGAGPKRPNDHIQTVSIPGPVPGEAKSRTAMMSPGYPGQDTSIQ